MRLLEVVRGKETAASVISTCRALGSSMSKITVVAGNCHGFIGNRMLKQYREEGLYLVEEGATPARVDAVLKNELGMAMGLFEMMDLAGNDIGYRQRQEMGLSHPNYPGRKNVRVTTLADRLCEAGYYGQKTGRGWYAYDPKNPRKAVESEATLQFIRDHRAAEGITPREISTQEILERCMFPLVNEGFKLLEEGFADRSEDIDIVYVHGYGFPRYRGGPM